jgi:hypothetical protein
MKKPNWSWITVMFGVSLFLGYVIFTAAIGAFFPSINYLSKPLVCRGNFEIETTRYSYKPSQVGWQHNVYCDGKDITLPSILVTGLIFSLLCFIVILIRFPGFIFHPENFGELAHDLKAAEKSDGKSTLDRLTELKGLRDKNLVSQVEYERKKDEIMKEL